MPPRTRSPIARDRALYDGRSERQTIAFEYIVNRNGSQWRIVNIVVDGISDLALKKAQYTSVIEREGFDGLLAKLSQKISDYAKK